ncbi:unnamed protein product [Brassica oleracea var. botrytis]
MRNVFYKGGSERDASNARDRIHASTDQSFKPENNLISAINHWKPTRNIITLN